MAEDKDLSPEEYERVRKQDIFERVHDRYEKEDQKGNFIREKDPPTKDD